MKLTNARLRRAIGIASDGSLIYPILGREDPPNKDDKDKGNENKDGKDGKEGEDNPPDDDPPDPSSSGESEAEIWRRRAQAADRAKGDLQKKLDDIAAKDKSELQRAQDALKKVEAERDAAVKARNDALIGQEFLKHEQKWHDPETALRLVDLESIQIDDDGKITGVKEAVSALAKAKPFLVQADSNGNGDGGNDGKGKGKNSNSSNNGNGQASGNHPPGNGGKPDDKQGQRDALIAKYKL